MSTSYEIIPGILEAEWNSIQQKLEICKSFANTVHIDIIDGKFVANTTFLHPANFSAYADDFILELHMMVDNPVQYIEPFAKVGFKRFLGHIEKMPDQEAFITHAKKFGEVGLAFDGPTQLSALRVPPTSVDTFLVYTSEQVGFSGPPFLDSRLEKIKKLRSLTNAPIEVDGGITKESLPKTLAAGATRFASTSYIFNSENDATTQYTTLSKLLP